MWQNVRDKEVAVVLRRSDTGGFSINTSVLDYYEKRVRGGLVAQAWVVLLDEGRKYLGADTILNVCERLRNKPPLPSREPDWCPTYYWIDDDFQYSDPDSFGKRTQEML